MSDWRGSNSNLDLGMRGVYVYFSDCISPVSPVMTKLFIHYMNTKDKDQPANPHSRRHICKSLP